jgi:hypothetical protein
MQHDGFRNTCLEHVGGSPSGEESPTERCNSPVIQEQIHAPVEKFMSCGRGARILVVDRSGIRVSNGAVLDKRQTGAFRALGCQRPAGMN